MSIGLFRANQIWFFRTAEIPLPDGVGQGEQPDVGRRGMGVGKEKPGGEWSREILVWDVMELSLLKRRSQIDGTTLQNYHII